MLNKLVSSISVVISYIRKGPKNQKTGSFFFSNITKYKIQYRYLRKMHKNILKKQNQTKILSPRQRQKSSRPWMNTKETNPNWYREKCNKMSFIVKLIKSDIYEHLSTTQACCFFWLFRRASSPHWFSQAWKFFQGEIFNMFFISLLYLLL